ncbi:hypothetical protein J0H58_01865 [bacterium]|nr:hypothetical protein [bacterium]
MAAAIIFVPALAGAAVLGFVFALFAANHYLTVMQSTAAGAKQVVWGDEPILDGFWKVFYLLWLAGLWAGPAVLASRVAGATGLTSYLVPLALVWLCYPVSQLSSLCGTSVWIPLHPAVFDRLSQKPGVALGFFVLSVVPLAMVGLGFYGVFRATGMPWLVGGCLLLVFGLYGYARLLGRLAFALMFTKSRFARRKKKDERDELPPLQTPPPADPVAEEEGFRQPSDLPPIETPDEGPLTGYDVKFLDDKPKPKKKRVRAEVATDEPAPRRRPDPDDDDTPYDVNLPEGDPLPEERLPESVVKPRDDEMKLLDRSDAPRKPKVVWSAEVLTFLAQQETYANGLLLSLIGLGFGGMVRICREFNPAAGG